MSNDFEVLAYLVVLPGAGEQVVHDRESGASHVQPTRRRLDLPADALVQQRIPKKMLADNGAPTPADRRLIQEYIEEATWVAALNRQMLACLHTRTRRALIWNSPCLQSSSAARNSPTGRVARSSASPSYCIARFRTRPAAPGGRRSASAVDGAHPLGAEGVRTRWCSMVS